MTHLANECIMLEDVVCTGDYMPLCPRRIYDYWRENWLEHLWRRISERFDLRARRNRLRLEQHGDRVNRSMKSAATQEPVCAELEAIAGLRVGPVVRCDARLERRFLRGPGHPHPGAEPCRARNRRVRDRVGARRCRRLRVRPRRRGDGVRLDPPGVSPSGAHESAPRVRRSRRSRVRWRCSSSTAVWAPCG